MGPLELVRLIAWQHHRRNPDIELDELVGVGGVALAAAMRAHDPEVGSLEVYARIRVDGAMMDLVRATRGTRRRWANPVVVSLDATTDDDARLERHEHVAAPGSTEDRVEAWLRLHELRRLPAREREVLLRRAAGQTLVEVGAWLGLSEASACLIEQTARSMLRSGLNHANAGTGASPLTRSQADVLRLAAHGFTNDETARLLGRSPETVKSQRLAAMRRLGARNVANAVYLAHELL